MCNLCCGSCARYSNMWKLILLWITEFVLFESISSLNNVTLTIKPRVVQHLSYATLECSYNLENESLYSVKWYRGTHEFYRYTPSENPSTKIFATAGIIVDEQNSNSTQVTLLNIDFPLSGKFTCEVTTDEPLGIKVDTKNMLVVKLPQEPPKISVGRHALDYGDTLQANCSSKPSRPRAKLTFVLNDFEVAQSEPMSYSQSQEFAWSDLVLVMTLGEFHFSSGQLILKCIAEIEDIYREEAVLKLDSAREPVPERVSADNEAYHSHSNIPVVLCSSITLLITLVR